MSDPKLVFEASGSVGQGTAKPTPPTPPTPPPKKRKKP